MPIEPTEQPPTPDDEYDDYADDSRDGCCECDGRGWKVVCIDDMCHGQDECIHGDPPIPCRVCNPKGDRFEGYWG